jgi:hypothetical protein
MAGGLSITGELLIPQALMQLYAMPELEHLLQTAGLLPREASQKRWRMEAETPGSYRLSFVYTVEPEGAARP